MQITIAKSLKKFQWLWILTLAFLLAGWLGHQSPRYAVEEGGICHATSAANNTPVPYPMTNRRVAQRNEAKGVHRSSAYSL